MRKTLLLTVGVVTALATGCAGMGAPRFLQPEVRLREARIVGLGLTGGEVDVVLSVYNPNGYRLDATRLSYNVLIDTMALASGVVDQRLTVSEKDSTQVRIPVRFTYSGIGEAGRRIINTGTVPYTVRGDVTVATPIGNFTVPYTSYGRCGTGGCDRQ